LIHAMMLNSDIIDYKYPLYSFINIFAYKKNKIKNLPWSRVDSDVCEGIEVVYLIIIIFMQWEKTQLK
jgi:hypothetical protein